MEVVTSGIIQFVSHEEAIISRGRHLFVSNDGGKRWKKWISIPIPFKKRVLAWSTWLSRLTRTEIHHLLRINEHQFFCIAFNRCFLIEQNGKTKDVGDIIGSRPLCVTTHQDMVYYGEYTSNKNRDPIRLFLFNSKTHEWTVMHTFKGIRHIHGVHFDPIEKTLWVTVGDDDNEAAVLRWNESVGTFEKIVFGSQQARTIDLIFLKDSIFFATDAPDEKNYIYKLNRKTHQAENCSAVGGPVFYTSHVDNHIFLSTVVEPSIVNRQDAVELWHSPDEGHTWQIIQEFKKDFGGKRYFQYGQIKFPHGPGDGENLWFTPYATSLSHKVVKLHTSNL